MSSDQRALFAHPAPDTSGGTPAFPVRIAHVPTQDWSGLSSLPWGIPQDEWAEHGVQPLILRRYGLAGMSGACMSTLELAFHASMRGACTSICLSISGFSASEPGRM
jgi:hypothetical protein